MYTIINHLLLSALLFRIHAFFGSSVFTAVNTQTPLLLNVWGQGQGKFKNKKRPIFIRILTILCWQNLAIFP